jgi:hypothetical protein
MRLRTCLWIFSFSCGLAVAAQEPQPTPAAAASTETRTEVEKPLPNLESLIARAKERSDAMQELEKSYTCKQVIVADEFDAKGNKKGTHTDEYQIFFVEKHEIHQHMARDGKPLSESDAKKEQERVDKQVADIKAHKVKEREGATLRISSLLKLATVSEPRREIVNGRPTIFFHYKGNSDAKANGIVEEVMKQLEGTLALDEQEAAIVHIDGTLQENFHIMGGLLVNVKKGSHFERETVRVNDEVWFVKTLTYHDDGRIFLFKGFDGDGSVTFSDYRKMRTSVTLRPGSQVIGEDGKPVPDTNANPEPTPTSPPQS